MPDALALPRVTIKTPGFPALAVGQRIVPLDHPSQPATATGWWIELLGGYVPRSPEAQLMRGRLRCAYDLEDYLADELAILKALSGRTARGVLRAHAEDGAKLSACRVAYKVTRGSPIAALDAGIERLNGMRIVRDMGATISGRCLS